ncbi:MAG TPA: hypothetical protein VN515_06660 [Terriglobales bacterium]|nr:hypothetical protein [Terriglobales bacterium]
MNGGRLSDDEAFLLGLGELRAQLQEAVPPPAGPALTRIAMRYPEEAEALESALAGADLPRARRLLADLEAQHRADAED